MMSNGLKHGRGWHTCSSQSFRVYELVISRNRSSIECNEWVFIVSYVLLVDRVGDVWARHRNVEILPNLSGKNLSSSHGLLGDAELPVSRIKNR